MSKTRKEFDRCWKKNWTAPGGYGILARPSLLYQAKHIMYVAFLAGVRFAKKGESQC